jgi:hypothetical protein
MLYIESASLASASGFVKTTGLPTDSSNSNRPFRTTYFRRHFTWNGPATGVVLRGISMIDDAAVFYLNGQEALRLRMPTSGTITFDMAAISGAIGSNTDAAEETIILPANLLVPGDNVLAVEVHQYFTGSSQSSSDVVMGLKLDAEISSALPAAQVVINEVLARNDGLTNPDGGLAAWVELYNSAATDADIADMSLSLSAAAPRVWVAPAGTVVPAGGHLVIHCHPATAAGANNTGFGLNPAGGRLHLFHPLAGGGGLRDSVVWGNQLPDLSIGRLPDGTGAFALNLPSRGGINTGAATGSPVAVRVNEWLANPASGPDWFELYNTETLPVPLGGNYLTDSTNNKTKQLIAPLSFIGGSGTSRWLTFIADNNATLPGHVNFALSTGGESLGFFTAAGYQLDAVAFGPQVADVSEGSFPDGSEPVRTLVPTLAAANAVPNPDTDGDGMPDAWEVANGLDPNQPADAAADADGDGMSNLAEYVADTRPQDPGSRLTATLELNGGNAMVRFNAQPGRGYTVQFSDSMQPGSWQRLADVAPQAVAGEITVSDPDGATHATRFYRVLTPLQL